ncbi:MAG: electron transfer flavoprotein subunit beta/FixA family protein [Roseiflexaceae bacterium]|nr:electron transfer flavoprotein subunit beta/FixA family protein [Roseiflexaceae bacterium]
MHIVVCVKQVPQQNSVKINADLSINSDGIENIISLFDEYAIEAALLLNEKYDGQVTILSIGPIEWKEQIRRALAMGATDAILLSDPAFAALDVLGAARVAAAAIRKLGSVDLVICGRNSTDDESGAFGPSLARVLGWPQATYVSTISEANQSQVVVERQLEDQIETVEAKLPAVISMIKSPNEPRYPSLLRIRKVAKIEIPLWGASDLGLSATDLAPALMIAGRVPPPARPSGEIIDGASAAEKVRKLVDKLLEAQVI